MHERQQPLVPVDRGSKGVVLVNSSLRCSRGATKSRWQAETMGWLASPLTPFMLLKNRDQRAARPRAISGSPTSPT